MSVYSEEDERQIAEIRRRAVARAQKELSDRIASTPSPEHVAILSSIRMMVMLGVEELVLSKDGLRRVIAALDASERIFVQPKTENGLTIDGISIKEKP